MKLRHLTLAAGLFGAVISNQTLAVGLGEMKLNSALNEPLDAEIQLLNIGELSELEMLVGLGSQKDFDNAGVERPFTLTDLRFEVDLSKPGNPVILVTSRKPLREPFLDFLVEIDWPTGRLLREYTVLLDLPLYATEKSSVKKIEAASSGPQPTSQSARQSTPVKTPAVSTPLSLSVGDDEYRVSGGDTVWAIAEKIRPQGASMAQTMAAIKQANPHAFINDNINLLKKGAVLRLPEGSDIAALSDVSIDLAPSAVTSEDAQAPMLDATPVVSEAAPSDAAGEGRLKLAALGADEALTAAAGVDGGEADGTGTTGSAADVLTVAREELDKTARENAELKDRIAKLEEQLSTMNRLVEIQDDSLRGTQVATQIDQEAALVAGDESVEVSNDEVDTQVAVTEAVPVSDSQVEPGKNKTFDLASLMDYLLYPAIGLLALLLAVLMFFRNRKQEDDEVEELSLQTLVGRQESEASKEESDQLLTDDDKEYIAALAEELDEEQDLDVLQELEELQLGDGEGVDPKGEADIYLSLGNYRQAEKILKGAIDADPDDSSLRLKLLEVYVNANNLEAFDEQVEQLAALNNPEADARALTLRAELAPETLAGETADQGEDSIVEEDTPTAEAPQSHVDFEAPTLDYDLGDVAPEEAAALAETVADENAVGTTDLEVPSDEEAPALSAEPGLKETSSQDFDLDLDLGDIDLDSLSSEIDQGMFDIDLDETDASELSAVDQVPAVDTVDVDTFNAPESLKEQTFEELEDAILSASETEDDDSYDLDAEMKDFGDEDVCGTKLVLAETYLDLGDPDNARDLLNEVVDEGTEEQKEKARNLLEMVT